MAKSIFTPMKKLVMTLIGLLSLMASMQAQTDWKSQLNYLYGTWTVQYIQDRNDNVSTPPNLVTMKFNRDMTCIITQDGHKIQGTFKAEQFMQGEFDLFTGLFVQAYSNKSKKTILYFQVYDINNSKGVISVPEVKEYWQIKKNLFEIDD